MNLFALTSFLAQTPGESTVTITFQPMSVVTWLIIGLIAGFLASVLVRGRRFGLAGSVIVGLIGALVGGALFSVLNIPVSEGLRAGITISFIDIIVAFVGAVIVLIIYYGLFGRRR